MRLKEAREQANMTQYELAKAAGVSVAAICRYEKGERTPRLRVAKRIGRILGIPWPEVIDNRRAG